MSAFDSDEAFDRLMDDMQVLYGLRAGHTVTQDDVDALNRLDAHYRAEEESATEVYHRAYQDGRRKAGGEDLVQANERADKAWAECATLKALRKFDEQRGFRKGAAACRETIARFVEQGGDATMAASIRLNWNPDWGPEPTPQDLAREGGPQAAEPQQNSAEAQQ
jgi:hypothetical protein